MGKRTRKRLDPKTPVERIHSQWLTSPENEETHAQDISSFVLCYLLWRGTARCRTCCGQPYCEALLNDNPNAEIFETLFEVRFSIGAKED